MLFLFVGLIIASINDKLNQKIYALACCAIVILVFASMNYNKVADGDWAWYTAHYLFMRDMSLTEYMGSQFGAITIKWNEPVYYSLAYALSKVTDGDVGALSISITLLEYTLVAMALYKTASTMEKNGYGSVNAMLLSSVVLVGVTFTLTTQLVRQELAVSLVALGFAFLIERRFFLSIVLASIAVACHQSAVFAVIILYMPLAVLLASQAGTLHRRLLIGASVMTAALLGYYVANSSIANLGSQDDGSVSTAVVVLDVLIFAGLAASTFVTTRTPVFAQALLISYLSFTAAMVAMSNIPLAALRLYFYLDIVRAFALLTMSMLLLNRFARGPQLTFSLALIVLAFWYNQIRIDRSPFDYGGTFASYLLYPLPT